MSKQNIEWNDTIWRLAVSQSTFNLHFNYDEWGWISFHMFKKYISMCDKIFPFSSGLLVFSPQLPRVVIIIEILVV